MTRARTLADLGSASLATDAELAAEVSTLDSTISGLALGKVLQVVTSTTTVGFTNNTADFVDTGLSVTITPQESTSTIHLLAMIGTSINWSGSAAVVVSDACRFSYSISGGASGSLAVESKIGLDNRTYGPNPSFGQTNFPRVLIDSHSPSTTSAVTYTVQHRGGNVTNMIFRFHNFGGTLPIMAIEVAA